MQTCFVCSDLIIHEFFSYLEPTCSENHSVCLVTTSYERKITLCVMKLKNERTNRERFRRPVKEGRKAAWPSGQRVGLAIRRSRVGVPLWPLAGFVLGRPEFKFSATFVNSQLVGFCQLGFLILLCCI